MRNIHSNLACRAVLATALIALCSTVAAERRQPQVVVTATRTPLAIEETLSSVSVIERDEIEASGSQDFVDLLRRQAGVDIIRGGGLGAQTSVFMRGSGSNQVLVLIDGVRVSSANTGGYTWEHLPLEHVERIEIVRGPRAALYGSDAIGGVIQIFTRRRAALQAAIGVGNHDTASIDLAGGRQGQHGQLGARFGWVNTAGFNAQNPRGFAFDPDRDGFRQRNLSVFGDYAWDGTVLDGALLRSDDDVEFDRGESNVVSTSANLGLSGGDANPWQLRASAAREDTDTPASFSRFESRRRQLDWQQAWRFAERNEVLWGASAVRERGRVLNTFSQTTRYGDERDHQAVFAAWRAGVAAWNWELAARHDDFDGFGGESTGQAALGWSVNDALRLRSSWGEGFRAPNLNELFSPGFGGLFAGNPALQPERSRNWEMGADWNLDSGLSAGLSLYRNRVRDLVDFSGGDTFQAINIGRARLQGAELNWNWRGQVWQLGGNVGWQDAIDQRNGRELLRRAPRKANLNLQRSLGALSLGLDLHAVAARPDFGGALPGYSVLGVSARYPITAEWAVDLRIDNLFDRHYELANGFNAPGTTALMHLRWSPAAAP